MMKRPHSVTSLVTLGSGSSRTYALLAALLASGCAVSPDPVVDDPDARREGAAPSEATASAEGAAPSEDGDAEDEAAMDTSGEGGRVRLHTGSGEILARYRVVDGRAIYQGDIDLGPADELRGHGERGVPTADLSRRWPGGYVNYLIDPAISATQVTEIQAAISAYEQLTPVRFHAGLEGLSNYVYFTTSSTAGVSSSPIGMQGSPNSLTRASVRLWSTHTRGVIIHELGHALGLWHEQSHPLRDAYVTYSNGCVTSGYEDQFDKQSILDVLLYSPYDLKSIMHYDSTGFCAAPLPGQPTVPGTGCVCFPLVQKGYANTDPAGWIHRTSVLSVEDVNTVNHMYAGALGVNEGGERFASKMVSADFDGDGYADLAVAAPNEAPGSSPASGAVFLYKGTYTGLVPWHVLTQGGLGANEAGDQFGASLAAGDLNRDGIADLVVGAPGEAPGSDPASGAIFLFKGGAGGLEPWDEIDEGSSGAGINEAGDQFGYALTIGDLDGDGYPDLAVGTPGEAPPGEPASGWVYTFRNTASGLVFWKGIGQATFEASASGARFGQALAAGDFNFDGKVDLAIGAPETGTATGAGAVYLALGGASGLTSGGTLRQSTSNAPAAHDAFGSAITVGDFTGAVLNGKRHAQLAIGAPGKDGPTSSGRIYLYAPWFFNGFYIGMAQRQVLDQSSLTSNVDWDHLGNVLVAADLDKDGKDELLAGVPEKNFVGGDAGMTLAFHGGSFPLTGWATFAQPANFDSAAGDNFGASIAVGDVDHDGRPDLMIGTPGEAPDSDPAGSGAFYFYYGQSSGAPSFSKFWTQETP